MAVLSRIELWYTIYVERRGQKGAWLLVFRDLFMWTLFIAIASVTFLYFFLALTRLTWRVFHVHVCVICVSVTITWVVLLALYLLGYPIDPTVLAILMGGSVVGSMYKLQELFLKKGWQRFWIIHWLLIVLGTIFIWSVLNERWLAVVLTVGVGIVVWLMIRSSRKK